MRIEAVAAAKTERRAVGNGPRESILRIASSALVLLVVLTWFTVLRPTSLGGPASYVIVAGTSMLPTISSGDLILALEQESYAIGDVVVYRVPDGELGAGAQVIHRIVGGDARSGYRVRGDNRAGQDPWRPRRENIVGRLQLHVPKLGRFFVLLQQPVGIAAIAALTTILVALGSAATPTRKRGDPL